MENHSRSNSCTREDDLDEIRSGDKCHEKLEIICVEEFSQLLQSKQIKWKRGSPSRRQMHIVPPQIRQNRHDLYDPVFVALGPYHHGKPELQQAEEFKYLCLDWCAEESEAKKCLFYNKVLEKIDEIRGCYAQVSLVEKYDDKALALMMLLDGCFLISFMEIVVQRSHVRTNIMDWKKCLGTGVCVTFPAVDMMLVENQIPFQVIKLIISLQYEKKDGECLIPLFLSKMISGTQEHTSRVLGEDENYPLHFLEARLRILSWKSSETEQESPSKLAANFWWPRLLAKDKNAVSEQDFTCRSVIDLKAKGIHFRSSPSCSLKDIRFKSHTFHGVIQLPQHRVSGLTKVALSNLIAYELSPDTDTDLTVLIYTIFIKSLIASPEDVKELQEKKILTNNFANDEQVVKLFEEIETFGIQIRSTDMLANVRQRIGEHCSSRTKTWMADLIHTRFDSPWTIIALLAATFLLCLTFTQTYFTIHPAN